MSKTKTPKPLRPGSKGSKVLAMLNHRWTSAETLLKETGWVSNTLRGFLGMLRARYGLKIERKHENGKTAYRIA